MRLILIDYSPIYYKTIAKKPLPPKRAGKFIQVRNSGKEYIVLSPKDLCTYHANIAERFFTEMGIAGAYNAKRDHYTVTAQGWEIVGGGVWAINEKEKSFTMSGSSLAYGRYDRRGLMDRLSAMRKLSGYTVVIE